MGLKIIKSGFRSLLQDRGRFGYHNIGLGISGAADEVSYLVGQYLLEHSYPTNSIEILLGNFVAEVQQDSNFSITGAPAIVTQNGRKIPVWSRFFAKKGDIIAIEEVLEGNLNYLSVEGGFEVEKFCGSYATNFKLAVGANFGKKITNQTLPYRKSLKKNFCLYQKDYLPKFWQQKFQPPFEIQLVTFPNVKEFFHSADLDKFFQTTYAIGLDSDRVGIRLMGEKIHPKKHQILSEGLSFGTIQIQNSGLPILLMKDCQTIGGYPKLGYVCALDSFWLAQLRAKQEIYFSPITAEMSQKKTKKFYQKFASLIKNETKKS